MLRSKIRVTALTVVVLFAGVVVFLPQNGSATNLKAPAQEQKGDRQKITKQPATIQAYETVHLAAGVSGFLKKQTVDIGDRVQRGQVLAVLDAADMEAQFHYDSAVVIQSRTRVQQAKARIVGTEAELETAKLAVKQAEANAKSAEALVRYREIQWKRMKDLIKEKVIPESMLDESKGGYESAVAAEQAAKAAVATTKAQAFASMTRIDQAKADLAVAEAGVQLAQAKLDRSKRQLSLATIEAPFDGVITQRGYFPGDFIGAGNNRNDAAPLFTVQRTDLMRVIVSIPERAVPLVEVGAAAEVEIAALPGKKWSAKIARLAVGLDPKTGTMRAEIDLPNPTGQIRSGMYGTVTILAEKRKE